jgi:protein-arginine kinase activator protein McsA
MNCDRCGSDEAVVRFIPAWGQDMALCDPCLEVVRSEAEWEMWLPSPAADFLFGLGVPSPLIRIAQRGEGPVCPVCGTNWSDFAQAERLGCPTCYEVFEDHLRLFYRFHE